MRTWAYRALCRHNSSAYAVIHCLLLQIIKDISEYRKLHTRATTVSAAAVTACAATAAARAASASIAASKGQNRLLAPTAANVQVAATAASVAAAAAAVAARGGDGSTCGHSHIELLESCCVAVLRVQVRTRVTTCLHETSVPSARHGWALLMVSRCHWCSLAAAWAWRMLSLTLLPTGSYTCMALPCSLGIAVLCSRH
jgi:hypothetical protein